jgi:hypothetical protein
MGNIPSSFNSGPLDQPVRGVFAHFPGIYDVPAASAEPTSTPTASTTTTEEKSSWWWWVIIGAVVLAVVATIFAKS